jgi:hypothetical protein
MFDRNRLLAHGASRIPGLKAFPVFRLLALAEVLILANTHFQRLTAPERNRLFELVKTSRGRRGNLSEGERQELAGLINKMEPRLFAGSAIGKVSPFPIPKRFTHGSKRERVERERDQRTRAA